MIFSAKTLLFIIIFYSLFFLKVKAQDYVLNYEQFTTKQGLANNFVNCIVEDKQGFIWLGTKNGLCRFDGHSYKIYKTDATKNHILLSNNVISVVVYSDSLLYLGTEAGVHVLNTSQNTITPIEELKNQYINKVFIDNENSIWAISHRKTIYRKKITQHQWEVLNDTHPELNGKTWMTITQQKINGQLQICLVSENRIESKNFVYMLHILDTNKWKPLFYESNAYMEIVHDNMLLVSQNNIIQPDFLNLNFKDKELNVKYIKGNKKQDYRQLYEFSSKIYNNHLYIPLLTSIQVVDLATYKVIKEIDLADTEANQNNTIRNIFIDTAGNLWVATFGSGILLFPTYGLHTIKGYRFNSNDTSKGLSVPSTRAIYQNPADKKIWIATYKEQVVMDIFSTNKAKQTLPLPLSHAFIIKEEKKNATILWIATYTGILKVDKTIPKVVNSYFENLFPQALEVNTDSTIFFADTDSIYTFNTKKEIIQSKKAINKTTYLYQDVTNVVWIGTETDGFASWDLQTDKITYYNPEKNSIVKNLQVKCIYEDTKGKFWIATTRGIYFFDKITKKTRKFDTQNGLPDNTIYGILEDQNYNLWLSTNKGISKFNIETETFENFDINDGLQDDEYNTHSFFKSKEGELFFGGIKGVDAFFPTDLKRNKHVPNLILTGFKQLGKEVQTAIPIEKMDKLVLPIDSAQMLTFEFTALNFYQNKRNQYAYKIEEIDTSWIQLGNKNELTLTNLAAGNYTLRIKGSNNHGVWNEEGITLKIKIVPPFWQQNWFLISLIFLFTTGVYVLYKVRIYQSQRREEKLEAQIKERTRELATANRNKDQLFAIIAHDLRSPLTAFEDVSSQIEYFLRKNKPQRLIELGRHIDTSIQGLNILLNNLLGWALIQQNHKIQTDPQVHDLSEIVERIIAIYQNVAQSNQIELKNLVQENIEIRVDLDSFQTILRNLVSNALKYTPQNGTVELSTIHNQDIQNQNITLIIKDTGIGMSKEMIKTVFDTTTIQTNRGIRGEKGTGLGLALCQEFAQINNIKIEVESEPNQGTMFYLFIPTS